MEIKKVKTVYFSPGKKTAKILNLFIKNFSIKCENNNITSYKKRNIEIDFQNNELAVFASPVYGGRIPALVADEFRNIRGSNTPAVIIAVYGNGSYGDALLEMQEILENNNLLYISCDVVSNIDIIKIEFKYYHVYNENVSTFLLLFCYLLFIYLSNTNQK